MCVVYTFYNAYTMVHIVYVMDGLRDFKMEVMVHFD